MYEPDNSRFCKSTAGRKTTNMANTIGLSCCPSKITFNAYTSHHKSQDRALSGGCAFLLAYLSLLSKSLIPTFTTAQGGSFCLDNVRHKGKVLQGRRPTPTKCLHSSLGQCSVHSSCQKLEANISITHNTIKKKHKAREKVLKMGKSSG